MDIDFSPLAEGDREKLDRKLKHHGFLDVYKYSSVTHNLRLGVYFTDNPLFYNKNAVEASVADAVRETKFNNIHFKVRTVDEALSEGFEYRAI